MGVAALAFLLSVNLAFRGALVGTLLGHVISVQVRGVDYFSAVLAIALGGLSRGRRAVPDLKERASEMVTLRTRGWAESHLARLVVLEGVGIGLVGSALRAGLGWALAWVWRSAVLRERWSGPWLWPLWRELGSPHSPP